MKIGFVLRNLRAQRLHRNSVATSSQLYLSFLRGFSRILNFIEFWGIKRKPRNLLVTRV